MAIFNTVYGGGGGGISITDNFSGTSLNTDIWETRTYSNYSLTVNNGLTISTSGGAYGSDMFQGVSVATKELYKGTEKKITVEYTISAEGGSAKEAGRGFLGYITTPRDTKFVTGLTMVYNEMSLSSSKTRLNFNTSPSQTTYTSASITNPTYTQKMILDIVNSKVQLYTNNTLVYDVSIPSSINLSNYVGMPLWCFNAYFWTSCSQTITSFSLTTE